MNSPWNRDGYYVIFPTSRSLLDCVFIPAEVEPSLKTLQGHVGGFIEWVRLPFPVTAYVNEEGKLLNLPFNPLATSLYANVNDSICGTMVVCCGKAREEQEDDK